MLLGFKTKLKLNNQQRTEMAKHAGVSLDRDWNAAINLSRWSHHQDKACG
ncbi:MAG: helix-turn-helix domain-containing protein [Xenococcus sp. MO_188.B8]|nr:helix-turn-helix domain-containing protein [Xenococcus sp. MO_188.B8]